MQTVVIAIAAVGMTFVIVNGGIDLSVGAVVALSGTCCTLIISNYVAMGGGVFIGVVFGILGGMAAGALCGFVSGSIITAGKLPPFIVTLGMMEITRGTALSLTGGNPVTGLPSEFTSIANSVITLPLLNQVFIPYSFIILLVVGIAAAITLNFSVFGRQVYSIGSNEKAAHLCGVNVTWVKMRVYMIGGLTAGIAGVLHMSRLNTGQPSEAVGMELDVIAAVVIGGGSLMGGEGTILGSIIGAFIIRILRNGCNLVGISPFIQRIVIGAIIITAVFLDQWRRRRMAIRARG